jgi:hypothetical protein
MSVIVFVQGAFAGNPNVEVTTLDLTIPSTAAGDDLLIGVTTGNEAGHGNPGVVVSSIVVKTGPAATFTLIAGAAITNDKMRQEVWLARNIPAGITALTITPASSTSLEVVSYAVRNVQGMGQVVTGSGSDGTGASLSITTQNANNVVVAFFGKEAAITNDYTSASAGVLRTVGLNGAINTDCALGTVDNTSATPALVTCTIVDNGLITPIERAAVAVELQSVPLTEIRSPIQAVLSW